MERILYLGTNRESLPLEGEVIRCPLIEIVERDPSDAEIQAAFAHIEFYTHLVFTSKHGVGIFAKHAASLGVSLSELRGKSLIAVGRVTARAAEVVGMSPVRIPIEETQEGIIALLEREDLKNAYFFLPRSSLSRPLLTDFLTEQRVRYRATSLYDTLPTHPHPLPDLTTIDTIIFTSPSTVQAFFTHFRELPHGKKIGIQGPVTADALKNHLTEATEVFYV